MNVNTELRTAMLETLEAGVGPARASGEDMLALTRAVLDKATGVARTVLETLGG